MPTYREPMWSGLCSSTPRGDGNGNVSVTVDGKEVLKVYAAQPREGTETVYSGFFESRFFTRFMQLNPARGRKLGLLISYQILLINLRFMQLNPARGRKPCVGCCVFIVAPYQGLCSSTPRGDGNLMKL